MRGLTAYQVEVLRLALAGNPAGEGHIDFDQLLDRLSWQPSKQSAQFTIRACIAKKVLEKTETVMRRGRHRICYRITPAGMLALDPRGPVPTPEKGDIDSARAELVEGEKSVLPGLPVSTFEVEIPSFRDLKV
jgi:hypothetical protein